MKYKMRHFFLLLITFSIPGVSQAQIDPGPNPGDTSSVGFTYRNNQVRYKTVRAKDGKVWLQQNLGSTGVATSTRDRAAYGDYFQWGRWDDGHQSSASDTIYASRLSANNPAGLQADTGFVVSHWWNGGAIANTWTANPPTDVNGLDPCAAIGPGWRMPTREDWRKLMSAESIVSDTASAFKSTLKLVPAGYRDYTKGNMGSIESEGSYWTSTNRDGISAYIFQFTSGFSPFSVGNFMARGHGFSIRCVKPCQELDTVSAIICPGSSYTRPDGTLVTASGTYIDILDTTGAGCDSAIISMVTLIPPITNPGTVTGEDTVCGGSSQSYHVTPVPGATSYVWTLAQGWTGSSDSAGIQVIAGSVTRTDTVSVYAVNDCGDTSAVEKYAVYVSAPRADLIVNGLELSVAPGYASYQWYRGDTLEQSGSNATFLVTRNGNYSVIVTDHTGCTDTSDIYRVNNVSIGSNLLNAESIHIYPNPATNRFFVSSPAPVTVTLKSLDGKTVLHREQARDISLAGIPGGIYMVYITDENGAFLKTEKLVKYDH